MKKTFVLDTNVLLHSHNALNSFADNNVVIPMQVLEELDRFKKGHDEKGSNARSVARELDRLRHKGNISKGGVALRNGGNIRVILLEKFPNLPGGFQMRIVDNQIISVAYSLKAAGEKVVFVSKDINARIKANILGISAADYEKETVDIERLYEGFSIVKTTSKKINTFFNKGQIRFKRSFFSNQFVLLKSKDNEGHSALAKYNASTGALEHLKNQNAKPWGIAPLNLKQKFAFEALLDDSIRLVTLVGKAGTGKTLLALASGLKKVMDENVYKKLLVARPIVPLGKDIGFLPGTKEEKLDPWMKPIFENMEFIIDKSSHGETDDRMHYLMATKKIELAAVTYIRGRSLPRQFFIIDEAQNLTPHEIKTIISRAGEDTKVVLTGDPYQIDNPYLDSHSNGLTYTVERFKGQKLFAHITLDRSERSELASLAVELL